MVNIRILPWDFEIWSLIFPLIFGVLVIILGIHPIHYTPTFLGILGIALIVFAVLIGGIVVLLATLIGAFS